MAINRRGFLAGAAALGCATAAHAAPIRTRLISAARRPGGTDELAIWSRNTGIDAPLAARGHGLAAFGGGGPYAIAARRPGAFVAIVEPSGQITERHAPVTGHIFAGHVLPVSRTRTFLATEIEAESGNGFAVLRRIGQKTPLAQWETVGLGPHDLTVLDGGARLVIANGGLETAEDHAGSMVDPDTIESSLALLDSHDGRLIRKVELDRTLRSLSIRHMAPSPDGRHVAFGMQDKKKDVWRPLVGVMDIDGRVELFDAPRDDSDALRGYVGSVAIDTSATYLAVTSPRGGRIEAWTLSDGRSVGGLSLQDVCGLAADHRPGTFWATTGLGEIKRIEISPAGLAIRENYSAPLAFDNHLVLV